MGSVARYNPGFLGIGRSIGFNGAVNWADPTQTMIRDQNGNLGTYDLLSAKMLQVGATSMSAEQPMDLTLLRELAHSFGVDHPAGDSDAEDTTIWKNCFK